MGASSSSPRTLSVDNPEPPRESSGTAVVVSEAALRRAMSASRNEVQAEPSYAAPPPPFAPDRSKEQEYWAKRIETLQRTHRALDEKMQQEYDKAVADTANMFHRAHSNATVGRLPPCQAEKATVLKCYTENPRQTLLCSQLVNSFNECVALKRSETVASGA